MDLRPFGNTGLTVPALGFGAGHVGDPAVEEAEVGRQAPRPTSSTSPFRKLPRSRVR